MAAFDLQVLLTLVDNLTGPLRGPMGDLQALERQATQVETGLGQMARGATRVATATALATPFALATREAINFESAMADVKKVINFESPQGLKDMRNDLLDLSERIPISAKGFAEIAAAAGQAGIARNEIVRFAEDAAKMGVAFDMAAGDAGAAMTGMRSIFRLTQDDVVLLGDSVNYLSNNMDAKASNLVDILNRVGGTGKLIGLTGQNMAALGATFLALKRPPEVAATGINALLLRLATAEQQAKPFQKGLESLGLTAKQVKGWMEDDAQAGLLRFLETVRGSDDAVGVLGRLFGAEYADDVAGLVNNLDLYRKALGMVGDQAKYAGSMQGEFAARSDTTENALQLLKNTVQNAAISLGEIMLPTVRRVTDGVTDVTGVFRSWADANPKVAQTVVGITAVLIGLMFAAGNTEMAIGALTVSTAGLRASLLLTRVRIAAATTTLIAMQRALIAFVTFGVPTAVQAALMATAFGRMRLAGAGLVLMMRGLAASTWAWTVALLANPITWAVAAVLALGAAFVYGWRNSEQFRDTVIAATGPIREAWAGLQASFASLGASLGPIGAAIGGFFRNFREPLDALGYAFGWLMGFVITGTVVMAARVVAAFVDVFGGLIDVVTGSINWIVGFVTGDTERMHLGVSQILMGMRRIWEATFGAILSAVLGFVVRFLPAIVQGVSRAYTWLATQLAPWRAWGVSLITGLVAGILSRIGGILSAIQMGVGAAKQWVVSTVGGWKQAGVDIVEGLIGGISSRVSGAVGAVQGLGARIRGAFTRDIDAHSPSRVFMTYGGWITEGLAQGVSSTAGRAVSATRGMALGVMAAGAVSLPTPGVLPAISPTSAPASNAAGRTMGNGGGMASSGPTIVIQRMEVRADSADDFMRSLQGLIEQHQ